MTNIRARQPYARRPAPQSDLKPFLDTELANIQRGVPVPLVRAVFADDVVMATDDTIAADATAGSIAITLPPPDRLLYLRVTITRTDTSGNDVVVSGAIAGTSSLAIAPGVFVTLQSNGTTWLLFERSPAFVDVTRFGAVADWNGTTGTDNWQAFTDAMAAFPHDAGINRASRAGRLWIPDGRYYLSQTWGIEKCVMVEGGGAGFWEYASGVELVFPKNVTGLRVYDGASSPSGTSAAGSVFRGLTLFCKEKDTTGCGIYSTTLAHFEHVKVEAFAEDNVLVSAEAPNGNASNSTFLDMLLDDAGKNNLHIVGADANVMSLKQVRCSNAGLSYWNILDESTIGNYYENCLTQGSGGSYKTTAPTAKHLFDNCYTEGALAELAFPTMVKGGTLSNSSRLASTSTAVVESASVYNRHSIGYAFTDTSDVVSSYIQLGEGSDKKMLLEFNYPADSSSQYQLYWNATAKGFDLMLAGSPALAPIRFPASGSSEVARGLCGPVFRNGYYNSTVYTGYASAAPTTGAWNQDDVIYKIGATAGGFIGWVCTTAGSPGTWKTFGAISP